MPIHDDLGTRLKTFYEQVPQTKLIRRMPVVIRIDGKAFHTFTRGFQKPFDDVLIKSMQETTKYLCENIQGCVFGYTQSDEISLVLVDYKRLNTSAWFDYKVQKMCSVAASMATMAFNKCFSNNILDYFMDKDFKSISEDAKKKHWDIYCAYDNAYKKGAMFDARVFNIPKEEVTNYVYWRQLDASRNSIQMVGQANFSHKELQDKTCNQIQDMLMLQKGINWNDLPTYQKRGSCVIKTMYFSEPVISGNSKLNRSHWFIDESIPIFKGEGRSYIDKLIYIGE